MDKVEVQYIARLVREGDWGQRRVLNRAASPGFPARALWLANLLERLDVAMGPSVKRRE
jgi:hypothetical protein